MYARSTRTHTHVQTDMLRMCIATCFASLFVCLLFTACTAFGHSHSVLTTAVAQGTDLRDPVPAQRKDTHLVCLSCLAGFAISRLAFASQHSSISQIAPALTLLLHNREAPTLEFLASRAVAFPLYHGEYVTCITGDYTRLPIKLPVHSVDIHLSSNRILTVSGSNKREMSIDKFDSRRANETHFEELRYTAHDMPMQICSTFVFPLAGASA